MNKENVISKINKYGKIGKIITTILLVIAGIGTFLTIISGIVLMLIPNDLITFNLDNSVRVTIDTENKDLGLSMTDSDKERISAAFESGVPTGVNMGNVSFRLDNVEFTDGKMIVSSSGNTTDISLKSIATAVFVAVIALILTMISLVFGRSLCKAFELCETPFEDSVITKLQHFAIALLPWALYSSVPLTVMNSVLKNSLRMNLNIDLNVIFTVLVIYALSIVFKYGAELQRESDETL